MAPKLLAMNPLLKLIRVQIILAGTQPIEHLQNLIFTSLSIWVIYLALSINAIYVPHIMPESHQIWAILEQVGSAMFWNLTELEMLSTSYIFLFTGRGVHPQDFCWLHYGRGISTNIIPFIFQHHIQSIQTSVHLILVQQPMSSFYKGIKKYWYIWNSCSTIEKMIATVIVWN